MAAHNETGRMGEKIAKRFLVDGGYEILDENWTIGKSEVDIIAFKDGVISFVEVKTRSSDAHGEPETFVDERKVSQLAYAAEEYIEIMDHKGEVRFDIISILLSKDSTHQLEHIEDAFWPD